MAHQEKNLLVNEEYYQARIKCTGAILWIFFYETPSIATGILKLCAFGRCITPIFRLFFCIQFFPDYYLPTK